MISSHYKGREHLPQTARTHFLSIFSDEHQKVQPVNHQQKCLIDGIWGLLTRSQIILVQLYLKNYESFEKLDKRVILFKKRVFMNK